MLKLGSPIDGSASYLDLSSNGIIRFREPSIGVFDLETLV